MRARMSGKCQTLWYGPSNVVTDSIIANLAKQNGLGPEEIRSFPNSSAMHEYLKEFAGQNLTRSVIDFTESIGDTITYRLYWNNTVVLDLYEQEMREPFLLPQIQLALENAIVSTFSTANPVIKAWSKPWPNPPLVGNSTIPFGNIKLGHLGFGFFGAGMVSLCLSLFWIVCLYLIVHEKDQQLRWAMTMMGMKNSAYWASWLVSSTIFLVFSVAVMYLTGYLASIPWFTHCDPWVVIILLTSYGFALTSMGFLISTLTATPRTAMIVAFIVNAVGFLLNSGVTTPLFIYSIFATFPFLNYIMVFYPSYNFAKVFADIAFEVYISRWFPPFVEIGAFGRFQFKQLFDHATPLKEIFKDIPQPFWSIIHLWWNAALFLVIGIYLDNVLNSNAGIKRPPWFCFLPSYWGCKSKTNIADKIKFHAQQLGQDGETDDVNVKTEKEYVCSDSIDDTDTVRIIRVEKSFSQGSNYVKALKGVSLSAKKGTCLSLLGHNGAGKTTLISVLCGLVEPSSGDAFIFGRDVKTDISEIRSFIGVCPQKDIYWSELTGYEHLLLFATLKGVPILSLRSQIKDILNDVHLYDVKGKFVDTYSGGMKRRLSVAMSMIGNPEIVFLDECTTGLDPKARRDVWVMIQKLKKDRLVILTTHSMEEADALSDKIAIMAFGNVVCFGDSQYLKNQYGNGYSLNLIGEEKDFEEINASIQSKVPLAKLISSNSGSFMYNVPGNLDVKKFIIPLLVSIEKSQLIRDWGISQTTLEEVYLTVTSKSKFGYGKDQTSQ